MKLKFAALSLMLGCAAILGACAETPTDSVEKQPINESVQIEPENREKSPDIGTSLSEEKQLTELGADPDKETAPDGLKSSEIPLEESAETFVIEEAEVEPQVEEESVIEPDGSVKSEQLKDGAVLEMKEVEIPADAQLTDPPSPDAAGTDSSSIAPQPNADE